MIVAVRSATLLRKARTRAGLTQVALAARAGVTQSVISAYESGVREPSLATLERLVSATGLRLELRVRRPRQTSRMRGPLGRRLAEQHSQVLAIAAEYGASNVRVFGSVARSEENADSDIDLLVDLDTEVGLLGLARLRRELEGLLQARVDLVPAGDLKPGVVESVMADMVTL